MDADWRDLEAIKRLKYKYMRCIDRKLWDELADVFVPDATAAYSSGKYAFTGREAILDFLKKSTGPPSTDVLRVNELVPLLSSEDQAVRLATCKELEQLAPAGEAAAEKLLDMIDDPDGDVCLAASAALTEIQRHTGS